MHGKNSICNNSVKGRVKNSHNLALSGVLCNLGGPVHHHAALKPRPNSLQHHVVEEGISRTPFHIVTIFQGSSQRTMRRNTPFAACPGRPLETRAPRRFPSYLLGTRQELSNTLHKHAHLLVDNIVILRVVILAH